MMQGGKGAVGSVMEAAANVAASAKSGLDKTKAVVEEKVERMSTKDEVEKDIATLRKEEKLDLAERRKYKAYAQNAAAAAPHGAVSPHFTDGGGFNTVSEPAAILSSNADLGTTPVPAASNAVDSNPNYPGMHAQVAQHIEAVDSNPNYPGMHAQVAQHIEAVDSNPNYPGMPAQVAQHIEAVDSNPNYPGMPAQVAQHIEAVDSNPNYPGMRAQVAQHVDSNPTQTEMPAQVVRPGGGAIGSKNDTTYMN